MELTLDFATDMSNRNAAKRLNRIRRETNSISPTTYRNTVEKEGAKIQKQIEDKCEETLRISGFNAEGALPDNVIFMREEPEFVDDETLKKAAEKLNIKKFNSSDYESAAVNISVDDICVKRQTEMRPRNEETEQPKRVNNSVIHVQNESGKYILNFPSLFNGLKLLIGFLMLNGLLRKQLVFFTDGAKEIHNGINKLFGFCNFKIILDWYHLRKKCREQLSMALKGSKIRNEFLEELLPCLWFGNVSGAIKRLENIDRNKVKDYSIITKLIEYFERVRDYIPNYAMRKELGLRNSSNLGEKANDCVVAGRQKHNGMSWSNDGSVAFTAVSALSCNGNLLNWVDTNDVNLELVCDNVA